MSLISTTDQGGGEEGELLQPKFYIVMLQSEINLKVILNLGHK